MAKPIKTRLKLQISGGAATPAVGKDLGQHQINIPDFCKKFNALTADRKGELVPVLITVYTDKTFDIAAKTPLVSELIKKKAKITKGSSRPHADKVGKITWSEVEEIAKIKMPDLNAVDIQAAKKVVAGSARSMGIEVV